MSATPFIKSRWLARHSINMRRGFILDANRRQSNEVVYQFCRQSPHQAILTPSHGRYVGAASLPCSEYRPKRGDRVGLQWRIPAGVGRHPVRHLLYDTNFWKTFLQNRLRVHMGEPEGCSHLGHDAERNRLFAEHFTSECRVRTEGRGRQVDEWRLPSKASTTIGSMGSWVLRSLHRCWAFRYLRSERCRQGRGSAFTYLPCALDQKS